MKRALIIIAVVLSMWAIGTTIVAADPAPTTPNGGGPSVFFWRVTWGQEGSDGRLITTWETRSNDTATQVETSAYYRWSRSDDWVLTPILTTWSKGIYGAEQTDPYQAVEFQLRDPASQRVFGSMSWNLFGACLPGPQFTAEMLPPSYTAKVLFVNTSATTLFLTPDLGKSWNSLAPDEWWSSNQFNNTGAVAVYTGKNMLERCASMWWRDIVPTPTPVQTATSTPTSTPTATLTPTPTPIITGVSPMTVRPGDRVTITGRNFLPRNADVRSLQVWLARQDGSGTMVKLTSVVNEDGSIPANYPEWNDTFISFRVEEIHPQSGRIYVLVNNRWARWEETFTIVNDPTPSPTPTPTSTPVPPTATPTATSTPGRTATPTGTWFELLGPRSVNQGETIHFEIMSHGFFLQGLAYSLNVPKGISIPALGCYGDDCTYYNYVPPCNCGGIGIIFDGTALEVGRKTLELKYRVGGGQEMFSIVSLDVIGTTYLPTPTSTPTPTKTVWLGTMTPGPAPTTIVLWTPTPAPWPTGIVLATRTPTATGTGTPMPAQTAVSLTPTPIPAPEITKLRIDNVRTVFIDGSGFSDRSVEANDMYVLASENGSTYVLAHSTGQGVWWTGNQIIFQLPREAPDRAFLTVVIGTRQSNWMWYSIPRPGGWRPDPRPMPAVQATTPTRAARTNPLIKEIRNE